VFCRSEEVKPNKLIPVGAAERKGRKGRGEGGVLIHPRGQK